MTHFCIVVQLQILSIHENFFSGFYMPEWIVCFKFPSPIKSFFMTFISSRLYQNLTYHSIQNEFAEKKKVLKATQ